MNEMRKAQISLAVNVCCFAYGLVILVANFGYLSDSNLTSQQTLTMLLQDVRLYVSWNLVVYLIYGVSLFFLSISLFSLTKKHSLEGAYGLLLAGGIWSGFMLLSGGISIETINRVSELYPLNSEAATNLWMTTGVIQESAGGGNEIIGALWVYMVSRTLPNRKGLLQTSRLIGFSITILGLGTIVESGEIFASLFGILLIVWFLLLFKVLPAAFGDVQS